MKSSSRTTLAGGEVSARRAHVHAKDRGAGGDDGPLRDARRERGRLHPFREEARGDRRRRPGERDVVVPGCEESRAAAEGGGEAGHGGLLGSVAVTAREASPPMGDGVWPTAREASPPMGDGVWPRAAVFLPVPPRSCAPILVP